MSEWKRKLTDLEIKSFMGFFANPDNGGEKIAEKDYPYFMDEGLTQTLYRDPKTKECVLFVKQKGYVMNALHITPEEMKDFQEKWDSGELFPYGKSETSKEQEKTDDENEVADDEGR